MAADGWQNSLYASNELFAISLLQIVATGTSAVFANYLLPEVSFTTNTTRSLKIFCVIFSVLCFTLLRLKSKSKFPLSQVLKLVVTVLLLAGIFHIMAILFGAPLSEQSEETFCWALLVSLLVTVPSCSLLGVEFDLLPRIFFSTWSDTSPENYFQHVIVFTVIGTWIGAFPIPLDWDRPWQVWPIPCVIGAILGYVVGLGTSAVRFTVNERIQRDKTKLI